MPGRNLMEAPSRQLRPKHKARHRVHPVPPAYQLLRPAPDYGMRKLSLFAVLLVLAGCQSAGQFLRELFRERPPSPLLPLEVTSDARIDSAGRILGSFVGEGTSRQVHLLSSDTGLIAQLARRYGPERARRGDVWDWLARQHTYVIELGRSGGSTPPQQAQAGSPDGHTKIGRAHV